MSSNYGFSSWATRRFAIGIYGLAFGLFICHSEARAEVLFDPASGSYFEHVVAHLQWWQANPVAIQHSYKGIRGRLAVIKSRETHEFLEQNFDTGRWYITWIGLRYLCGNRKLTWVTGETVKAGSDFQPWHRKWHRSPINCSGNSGYMPVYYEQNRWQASGSGKAGTGYIVEYPAQQ